MTDQERLELERLWGVVQEAEKERNESAVRLAQSLLHTASSGLTPARRWRFIQADLEDFEEDNRLYKNASSAYLDAFEATRPGAM